MALSSFRPCLLTFTFENEANVKLLFLDVLVEKPAQHFRHSHAVFSAIREGYVSFLPANPENPRIIDAVLKRLCMILYPLKYASETHPKDSINH